MGTKPFTLLPADRQLPLHHRHDGHVRLGAIVELQAQDAGLDEPVAQADFPDEETSEVMVADELPIERRTASRR